MATASLDQNIYSTHGLANWLVRKSGERCTISTIEYHVGGRVSLLGISLLSLAEGVSRVCLGCIALVGYLMTLGGLQQAKNFGMKQMQKGAHAGSVSLNCFRSLLSPKELVNHLKAPGPVPSESAQALLQKAKVAPGSKIEKITHQVAIRILAEQYPTNDGIGDLIFCSKLLNTLKVAHPHFDISLHPVNENTEAAMRKLLTPIPFRSFSDARKDLGKVPTLFIHGPIVSSEIPIKKGPLTELWHMHEYSCTGTMPRGPKFQILHEGKIINTGLGKDEWGIFCNPALYKTMKALQADCDPEKIKDLECRHLKDYLLKNDISYGEANDLYYAYSHGFGAPIDYIDLVLKNAVSNNRNIDICLFNGNLYNKDRQRQFLKSFQSHICAKESLEKSNISDIEFVLWDKNSQSYETILTHKGDGAKKVRIVVPGGVSNADITTLLIASQPYVLVTGDQSLGEALSAGKIIGYEAPGHKTQLRKNLCSLAHPKVAQFLMRPDYPSLSLLKDPELRSGFRELSDRIFQHHNLEKRLSQEVRLWLDEVASVQIAPDNQETCSLQYASS